MAEESTYDLRKRLGLCVLCGKKSAVPDRVLCEECAAKSRFRSRVRQSENTALINRKRDERRKNGLCIDCGSPVQKGHTRCSECLYCKRVKERIKQMRIKKGTWTGEFMGQAEKEKIAAKIILRWKQEAWNGEHRKISCQEN